MFRTVKSKFIFFTIIFILLSVGIPTFFLIIQFRKNFEQRSEAMLDTTLDVLMAGVEDVMLMSEQKNVDRIVEQVSAIKTVEHLRIFDKNGIILYSSNKSELGKELDKIAPHHIIKDKLNERVISRLKGEGIYSVSLPIMNKAPCQKCHGQDPVIAFVDIDSNLTQAEQNFYTGYFHIVFLAIAIVLILCFGFYYIFNHLINKPLAQFISAMEEVEKGNLDIHLQVTKQDEIGILKTHFNQMVLRLYHSQEKIQQLHNDQLLRADKMVTLGELAAEMAHEVNNPAAIILSRADYLEMEAEKNPNLKKYREDIRVIINHIHKVSKITGNILKYSKKLPKKFNIINLVDVIDESIRVFDTRISNKNITVITSYVDKTVPIFGDAQQLEQVLINLLNNAIDASMDGGEIKISVNYDDRNRLSLIIQDNGVGIEENIRDKIFSPFFTTKSANKGTGLGLYIVKNICTNHNADITCESKPNQGTRFTIIFHPESSKNEEIIDH